MIGRFERRSRARCEKSCSRCLAILLKAEMEDFRFHWVRALAQRGGCGCSRIAFEAETRKKEEQMKGILGDYPFLNRRLERDMLRFPHSPKWR